jgi:hypothetical protein
MASTTDIVEIQDIATAKADEFLERANDAATAREAADWSLAAKNAMSVAASCETIRKIRGGR